MPGEEGDPDSGGSEDVSNTVVLVVEELQNTTDKKKIKNSQRESIYIFLKGE